MATQENTPTAALLALHGSERGLLDYVAGNVLPTGVHERSWTIALTISATDTSESVALLTAGEITGQAAGFRSARLTGPIEVSVVPTLAPNASLFLGTVVVAIAPTSWGVPGTPGGVLHSAHRVVLGLGSTGAPPSASLALPPGYKDNCLVTQPVGEAPAVHAYGVFKGFSSVTVLLSGKVELASMKQLVPSGWSYKPRAATA